MHGAFAAKCSRLQLCSARTVRLHRSSHWSWRPDSCSTSLQPTAAKSAALCPVQVFRPYGSPYTLPIPTALQPTAVTTAPNISYPDVASGGLMALANATTNFGLRFSGEGCAEQARIPLQCGQSLTSCPRLACSCRNVWHAARQRRPLAQTPVLLVAARQGPRRSAIPEVLPAPEITCQRLSPDTHESMCGV